MLEGEAIKDLTRRMQERHAQAGQSLAMLHMPPAVPGLVLVNIDPKPCLILGEVTAKDIRTYLWERRMCRTLKRARAALWTMKDGAAHAWIGMAEWVHESVAAELARRSPVFRVVAKVGAPQAQEV